MQASTIEQRFVLGPVKSITEILKACKFEQRKQKSKPIKLNSENLKPYKIDHRNFESQYNRIANESKPEHE